MTIYDEERNILMRVHEDMTNAKDKDGVYKIYRQARIWNRFHYFLAKACTEERYRELNDTFKNYRNEARERFI